MAAKKKGKKKPKKYRSFFKMRKFSILEQNFNTHGNSSCAVLMHDNWEILLYIARKAMQPGDSEAAPASLERASIDGLSASNITIL